MIWRHPLNIAVLICATLLSLSLGRAAFGCDTPVHRYAMYRWLPSPYYVYYLHRGQEKPGDQPANRRLIELIESATPQTNVQLFPVDLSKPEDVENLPQVVEAAWKKHQDEPLPLHLVFTPYGTEIYAGRLGPADAQAIVSSQARKRLAEMLSQYSGVLVLLTGSKDSDNQSALSEVQTAIRTAHERPLLDRGLVPSVGSDDKSQEYLNIGLLEISRNDPQEQWLIKSLLAVEEIEPEYQDLPMVFAVYGRGRALEPCIGQGIIQDNLLESIIFLNGPCSCQVKEQNPGMDLLMSWDWESTAIALAERVGEETGNEDLLAESLLGAVLATGPEPSEPRVTASAAAEAQPTDLVAQGGSRIGSSGVPPAAGQESGKTFVALMFPVLGVGAVVVLLALVLATVLMLGRRAST